MKYITYKRVSTEEQGRSGLGLQAQQRDIRIFLEAYTDEQSEVLQEFTEVLSGTKSDRPVLNQALDMCRKTGAVLLVSKLDRLSRSVAFIANLLEDKKLNLQVCQMPHADKFQLHIYAALAEQERDFISKRTKAALAEAKARGIKLGAIRPDIAVRNQARKAKSEAFAETLRHTITGLKHQKMTVRQIAESLNNTGVKTSRGGIWSPSSVHSVIKRLGIS